ASVNSASGRVVMGWFPRHRRGLAMGIRQMSQPLGTSIAAVTVPPVAAAGGFPAYLWFVAAVTGALAIVCFALLRNPPSQVPTRAKVADLERRNSSEPAATADDHTEHGEHEEAGPTSAAEGRARPSTARHAPRAGAADLERRNSPEPPATADHHRERDVHDEAGPTSAGEGRARQSSVLNPYRGDSFLCRLHAVSALLIIPQFAFSVYGLVWLIA